MARHFIYLRINEKGQLICTPGRILVKLKDQIVWKWKGLKDFPFGIVIKSPFTPLPKHFYITSLKRGTEKKIEVAVLKCAPSGHYPYMVAAYVDNKILAEDPEIIVRPPDKPPVK